MNKEERERRKEVARLKRNEYSKKYYREHRHELLDNKRERYNTDQEYHDKVLDRAKSYQRSERAKCKRRKRNLKDPKEVEVCIDGKVRVIEVFNLRQLSVALGKNIATVRGWEERGILPKAMYRESHGVSGGRLYPKFQFFKILEAYAEVIEEDTQELLDKRISYTSFQDKLREIWARYPRGLDPAEL